MELAVAFKNYFQYVNMTRLDIEFMKRINAILNDEVEELKSKRVMTDRLKNLLKFKNNIWCEFYITEIEMDYTT